MSASEVVSSATVIVFIIFIYLQSNSNNMNDDPREEFVVRVCRLPSSATAENLAEFFSGESNKIF